MKKKVKHIYFSLMTFFQNFHFNSFHASPEKKAYIGEVVLGTQAYSLGSADCPPGVRVKRGFISFFFSAAKRIWYTKACFFIIGINSTHRNKFKQNKILFPQFTGALQKIIFRQVFKLYRSMLIVTILNVCSCNSCNQLNERHMVLLLNFVKKQYVRLQRIKIFKHAQ